MVPEIRSSDLPLGAALLVQVSGPAQFTKTFNRLPIRIGRRETNDVVLLHPPFSDGISRDHAQLCVRKGRVILCDESSGLGVRVNGARIKEQALNGGDRIEIGPFRLEVSFTKT